MTRPAKNSELERLFETVKQPGIITWIGVRPARREPLLVMKEVEALVGKGLLGDRFSGSSSSKRQVTLIQEEHIFAIASFMGVSQLDPGLLRRNLVVKGFNLLALKDRTFRVGGAILEMTGLCHPCSRMEEALGEGGYNAVRGHGGITARVVEAGLIRLGDAVILTG